MTTRQLSQRLRRLEGIWEKRKFTLRDVWDYLDLIETECKFELYDWGHQIWILSVGKAKYEVDIYFNDLYKALFKDLDKYDEEVLYEIEFSQQIENIFVEKIT